jgi:hypothetical protein
MHAYELLSTALGSAVYLSIRSHDGEEATPGS